MSNLKGFKNGLKEATKMKEEKVSYVDEVIKGAVEELARIEELNNVEERENHENYRDPLAVDITHTVKVLLSTGGPEDGFKLTFSVEKELLHAVYYRADWGTYKEFVLTDDEAQTVFDFYLFGEFPGEGR